MSTTSQASSSRAQSSTLAASAKFRTFALTFAIAGTLIYLLCLQMNWPLFTFHPATNRFAWGWEAARSGEGPAMYWYGWTATSLLAGGIVSYLATLLPDSVSRKIPLFLIWLLPILAIPYLIYDLRQWWFHP
jgi:hypothetical protein